MARVDVIDFFYSASLKADASQRRDHKVRTSKRRWCIGNLHHSAQNVYTGMVRAHDMGGWLYTRGKGGALMESEDLFTSSNKYIIADSEEKLMVEMMGKVII